MPCPACRADVDMIAASGGVRCPRCGQYFACPIQSRLKRPLTEAEDEIWLECSGTSHQRQRKVFIEAINVKSIK